MKAARSLLRSPLGPTVIAAAVAVCACTDEGPVVVVHVQARAAVADVTLLSVALANESSSQTESFAVAGRDFPLSFSVQVPGRDGDLSIDVTARDGDGLTRGLGAAVVPIGEGRVDADLMLEPQDFVVNTTFAGSQDLAFRLDGGGRQLAVGPDGTFTIGWSDTCPVVNRCDVFGRRFDATGAPIDTAIAAGDGQFNINQTDGETGYEPSLVTDRTGNTLAAWTTFGETYAVVIDDAGAHVTTSETILATGTSPGTPAVTVFPDGRYLVAWADTAPTAGQTVVLARMLSAAGLPINNPITSTTAAFTVSTAARTTDETPAAVALGNGSALAFAWRVGSDLRGRFYGAAGTPASADLLLASHGTDLVGPPQLAVLGSDVVLAYRRSTTGGDADNGKLILRRYSPSGAGLGTPVTVTDDIESGPVALAVSGDRVGLAWAACETGSDGAGCGVRFRAYDANLAPLGDAVLVNSTTVGDQEDPSLGWLPDGSAVVTWSDTSATDPDRDGTAVRARIIYPAAP